MQRRDLLKLGASVFAIPAAWAQQAAKPDWAPAVFDPHQNDTVIALTELIVPQTDTPGAKAARVNRFIDLYLRDGSDVQRTRFLEGLNWLDGDAIRKYKHPFVHCSPADQTALLQAMDTGTGPGHDFFRQAKSMTVGIYYNTQIGYQELNKGGRVPSKVGCDHGSHA